MSSAIMLISVFIFSLLATPQLVTKVSAQEYTEYTDTLGDAEFAVRFPDNWNGMLVVECRGYNPNLLTAVEFLSLSFFTDIVNELVNQGFAVAVSNYGAAGFCIQKGITSTHELTTYLVETYDVTGKIFLWGISMGGAVALLLGETYPNIYSGVLDMYGVKDLKEQYTIATFTDSIELETGGTPETHPQAYEDRSPTYHANITIPVITIHGTSDTIVPFNQAIMYQTAVANAGRSNLYRLYNVTGAGHVSSTIHAELPLRFAELVAWSDAITPPTVTVSSPTNTTYQEDPQLQFTVDKTVTWMGYSLDGQDNVTTTENTVNLTKLPNGLHSLTVYANDTDGNTGASEAVTFTIQKVLPTIAILSPENTTYNIAEIVLNFTVNDEVSEITCCLDEQDNVIIGGNTTLTGLTNGNHKVTVYATDTSGNTIQSETIYFTVDAGIPTWITALIAIIAIIAICAVILIYLKKTKKTKNTTTNT
jgi:predicted esterase